MSVNQFQINPETHPADAAMQREHSPQPSGSTLTAEELAGYSTMSPADLVTQLANQNVEVPRDSPLHRMSGDQLKAEMQRSMKAIQDFRSVAQSVNRLEQRSATSNDVTGLIGFPAFDSQGNAILDQTGSEYEKASRAADESRRSAARAGVGDYEYDAAVAQLHATAPNAPTPATASGVPYEIEKRPDGSYVVQLDTNERFVGRNADEIIEKLAHSKHKSSVWGRQLNSELKQYRNGQTPTVTNGQPQQLNQPSMDSLITDPEIAERFAKSVGFSDAQEMISDYQRTQTQLAEMQSKLEAANQFAEKYENEQVSEAFIQANQDFPGDQHSIDTLIKIMDASDLDYSKPENLGLAHQYAVKRGFYRPLSREEIQASYQPPSQQSSGRTPPPQPPGGNNPDGTQWNVNPWQQSTDELKRRVLEGGGLGKALLEMKPGETFGV